MSGQRCKMKIRHLPVTQQPPPKLLVEDRQRLQIVRPEAMPSLSTEFSQALQHIAGSRLHVGIGGVGQHQYTPRFRSGTCGPIGRVPGPEPVMSRIVVDVPRIELCH